MKILVVALLVLALGCGSRYGWVKPDIMQIGSGSSIGQIVDRRMYLRLRDVPLRFQRPEDPITGPVYLLFDDRGYACSTSPENFTMALDHDPWPCNWRPPRGI